MIDPVVLFFLLGVLARVAKSDLRLPEALYEALSIYLLLAIGLKGGAQLAQQPVGALLPQVLAAVALGAVIPLLLFPVLRRVGRLPRADSASIAAHYGSVSVVTFAVGLSALAQRNIGAEPYMPLLVALMETPGIVTGIVLARAGGARRIDWGALAHEVLFGKSVLLLLGGLAIGALAGPTALKPIEPLFLDLFKGVLALFLLEMGLVAGGRLQDRGAPAPSWWPSAWARRRCSGRWARCSAT
ncbi:MAG: sodium-dependent bicarbonate transport family permease [Burkholderiaceae bacterium]|nr:sodium-dependent bicarbonate transport family permease [Burkholderiaceae bacterium]